MGMVSRPESAQLTLHLANQNGSERLIPALMSAKFS